MGCDTPLSDDRVKSYSKLFSRRVDLIGDYAGSEPFLIEGDSLLLHCFSDDKLDFKDGFQMLHAVWLVESFLHGLQRRNCNFHLAFFDDHAHLCVPSHTTEDQRAKFLLARAVILRHLQINLVCAASPIRIFAFSSFRSHTFDATLAANGYMFIMMNDGAADACDCPEHARNKASLRLAIYFIIIQGYSVALINGLEFKDTKAVTAIIEGASRRNVSQLYAHGTSTSTSANYDINFEAFDPKKYEVLSGYHAAAQPKLSERLYLVAMATAILLSTESLPGEHAAAFLAHAAIQDQLRLGSRSLQTHLATEGSQHFLNEFAKISLHIMKSPYWKAFIDEADVVSDIADLVDGRLFSALLSKKQLNCQVQDQSRGVLESLVNLTALLAGDKPIYPFQLDFKKSDRVFWCPDSKLLPFSNEVFVKHLEPVNLNVNTNASQDMTESSSKRFRELTHWHNAKRPLDSRTAMLSMERTSFIARLRNQRLMTEMMVYAASLTNAVGKALEPETIVLQKARKSALQRSNKDYQPSQRIVKTSGGNNKRSGKKQAIMDKIAADMAKKDALNTSKIVNAWHIVCKDIHRVIDASARYSKAMQYLNSLQDSRRDVIGAEVELYALRCLLILWESSIAAHPKSPDYMLAAKIWDSVARQRSMAGTTYTVMSKLQQTVNALGLPFSIDQVDTATTDRPLPFEFVLRPIKTADITIPLHPQEFQLLHCGPYFDRKMDSAPDSRVPFLPDGWQRRVLDAIDSDKSLFVVAPTSAGKTFISFYAMKRVLEGSDDDVLVYVAPTKALVNQIAAEIQARFSKSYKHVGKSVWGIHTRDYRVNSATSCQVLVTVPHILQIMLLAPANADSWSARIKRIIFDEVHCIGQAEDGIVWEQLLLFTPCPIIALSATVGNPAEFHGWLASAQKAVGHEVVMVHHPHRYSDLRKFIYTPPKNFIFTGLPKSMVLPQASLDNGTNFQFVHPVASLSNRSRGIPEDFSLEARDCYLLWKAMKAHESEGYKVDDLLSPNMALPALISQADIITWGQSLKHLLGEWITDRSSPFDSVVKELSGNLLNIETEDESIGHNLSETVLSLLYSLYEQCALPAILFNYDRSECETLCGTVLDELKIAEAKWKKSSRSWVKKMEAWELWKKTHKSMSKKGVRTVRLCENGIGKADLQKEAASQEADTWERFDPNAPIDGFHFMDSTKLHQSELDEYTQELRSRGVSNWLLEALYRGIAVHHAGMNRKYRHVVEVLFRKGYLKVVIATGTLALGINMPCKTVVFCGDSVFLTALNFRQAAGRAGRRGFDVLGNVVFHGIPLSKVYRLLSSRLPDLTGHFPITTTLVLRLCTLLSESKHSKFSVCAIDALLSQPRLFLGSNESRATVLHHLRFSLEYLRRQYLLDQKGAPLNFAGCVSHLYYTESSNFAFHALLKEGYFHRLCAGSRRRPQTAERINHTLMLVLSHIFGRQYCRQVDRESVKVIKQSPSTVFLPPLPGDAAAILHQHNEETLDIFSTYVRTFVKQHVKEDDCILPLTGIKFGGNSGNTPTPTIRSHFVALSGHDDKFETISELCRTVRAGVFLEEAVIPHIPLDTKLPLNAYLFDFFKHGDIMALVKANKIRKGDVWFVLNDFSMILATIITSLMNFIQQDVETQPNILDAVGAGDTFEEEVENRFCEVPPVESKKKLPVGPKKNRIEDVADSWDVDLDEDDSSGEPAGTIFSSTNGHSSEELRVPAWENERDGSLLDVLDAFKKLSDEFNEKFKAIWA